MSRQVLMCVPGPFPGLGLLFVLLLRIANCDQFMEICWGRIPSSCNRVVLSWHFFRILAFLWARDRNELTYIRFHCYYYNTEP